MDTFDYTPYGAGEQPASPEQQDRSEVFTPAPQTQYSQVFTPAPQPENQEVPVPAPQPAAAPEEPAPSADPVPQPEPAPQPRRQAAPKKSPYADSPYVCMPRQEEPFRYVPQTQPTPKAPRKKKSGFWRRALAAVLTIALVAGGCCLTAFLVDRQWNEKNAQSMELLNQQILELQQKVGELENQPASSSPTLPDRVSSSGGLTPAQVYAQNVSSVVAVNVVINDYYYGQGTSAGSGFILTEDGYIVTNYHVVEGATSISVSLVDGTTLDAVVAGYDSTNDVAVLKADAQGLPAARLGSSSSANVGDMVVAIGNPLGELSSTQTVGYICGKDREITTGGTIINMLQTDAAINPGNSGGPLFNMAGEVIGITTAKYSGTTSSGASIEGIGFAIPIDDVLGIIGDLQSYGYVTGAYLGVTVQNVDSSVSAVYGITGAYVVGVEPGYAADRAGIQLKDLIVALNGQEIGSITDLTRALRNYKAGDTVTMTLIRNGIRLDVDVTLDEKPQDFGQTVPEYPEDMPSEGDYDEWYDFFFGE